MSGLRFLKTKDSFRKEALHKKKHLAIGEARHLAIGEARFEKTLGFRKHLMLVDTWPKK